MSNVETIFEAVEFIEANLKEAIAVADIADAVGYSLYHFCRVFNRAIKHSPYDYLMRRRLSESAQELIETDKRILDIACDYQFNSHETYSRAFKRMFETQPSQLRKRGRTDGRRLMPRLTLAHIQHVNKGEYLKPVLEQRDAFQVAGVMTLVKKDQTVIPELWEMLAQELEGISIQPETYYGIAWYPEDWEERGFFYLAGIEIESADSAGSALVVKTIPAARYARFIHKGSWEKRPLTLDYIYHTWLSQSGQSLAHPLEIEYYGQDFRGYDDKEAEWEVYIPIESRDLPQQRIQNKTNGHAGKNSLNS